MPSLWNPSTRRYERNGKPLDPRQVRGWVDSFVNKTKDRIGKIAEDFRDGKINRSAWYTETRQAIKEMHMAASMIAQGGREQMTVREWGRAGNVIKDQLQYLDKFNNELFNGAEFTDAEVVRAKMYADAGYAGYENTVKERERAAGVSLARRVATNDAGTCDGCAAAATSDFIPIDEVLPIGDAGCLSNCRCEIEYQEAA